MNKAPKYQHDCNRCVFLGNYRGTGIADVEVDLYVCAQNKVIETVIYRYGDNGNYGSGLVFAQHGAIPELVEALRRAKELGFME